MFLPKQASKPDKTDKDKMRLVVRTNCLSLHSRHIEVCMDDTRKIVNFGGGERKVRQKLELVADLHCKPVHVTQGLWHRSSGTMEYQGKPICRTHCCQLRWRRPYHQVLYRRKQKVSVGCDKQE